MPYPVAELIMSLSCDKSNDGGGGGGRAADARRASGVARTDAYFTYLCVAPPRTTGKGTRDPGRRRESLQSTAPWGPAGESGSIPTIIVPLGLPSLLTSAPWTCERPSGLFLSGREPSQCVARVATPPGPKPPATILMFDKDKRFASRAFRDISLRERAL